MSFYARFFARGALASLEKLFLTSNGIGDEGMSALAKAITPDKDGKGALASLKELQLGGNQIGDDGLKALAEACASGALDKLTVLHLGGGNQITDDGFATLMPFLKKGGELSNLTKFSIGSGVTDKGMKEFADILSSGALASLEKLLLNDNGIGDEGMSALAKAITPDKDGKGALAPGAIVFLSGNNATETGKQAMLDAAKARGLRVYF